MDGRPGPAPRFCYVVLAHTDAPAVLRLARRIRELSPTASVLVRHAQPEGYLSEADAAGAGASLLRSELVVSWGLFSLTAAALEALQHARATTPAKVFVLLSGQDYPVRDLAAWESEVVGSGADATFEHYPTRTQDWAYAWHVLQLPARATSAPPRLRRLLTRSWRHLGARALAPALRFYRIGNHGASWALGVRRLGASFSGPPVRHVGGSFWMALTARAVDAVLDRHLADLAVRRFFAPALVPDHSYIQSLLHDHDELVVRDAPVTHARVDPGEWNPALLTVDDLRVARASGAAFARKLAGDEAQHVVAAADGLVDHAPLSPHRSSQGSPRG